MITGETKLLLCEQRSLQSRAWEVGWASTASPWLRWDDHCMLLDHGVNGEHLDNGDVRVDWTDDLPARSFYTDLWTYENPIILELDESKLKKIDREARAWWWGSWGQALGRWVVFNDFMIQLRCHLVLPGWGSLEDLDGLLQPWRRISGRIFSWKHSKYHCFQRQNVKMPGIKP